MSGAWARLVNWDGSDEFLELCSGALIEVQAATAHRLAEKIRNDEGATYLAYPHRRYFASLIDPEVESDEKVAAPKAPNGGLRQRYAEAFRAHFGGPSQCTPGFANALAGVALAVRDDRMERLVAKVAALEAGLQETAADALKHKGCHMRLMAQVRRAEQAAAALARVRDAAALHRKGLLSTAELYAVIEATLDGTGRDLDGPTGLGTREVDPNETDPSVGADDTLRTQVRRVVKSSGLKQAWIADRLGISQKHLSQMLTGKAPLTLVWAARILALCGQQLTITTQSTVTGQPDTPAPAAGSKEVTDA